MNVQLLSGEGYHNANIARRSAEVRQGGSWKKQRVIVILPASDLIPAKVALSHWSLAFPPNQAVHRMLALGEEVGVAYTSAIEAILNEPTLKDWEYILTKGTELPAVGPKNPKYHFMIETWKKLPLSVATALGPHIVRGIP